MTSTNSPSVVPKANPSAPTLHIEFVFLLMANVYYKMNYWVSSSFFNQTTEPALSEIITLSSSQMIIVLIRSENLQLIVQSIK